MTSYEIVFFGELQPGFNEGQVCANLCQLFKADEARIKPLFSGRRTVLKKGLDLATAEKYRAALERAGAWVELVNPDVAPAVEAVPEKSTAPMAARDNYMAAFSHIDAPDLAIAPVGSRMQEELQVLAPAVDISQLSLAPVGSDMDELKAEKTVLVPDTSHLTLQ